LIFPQIKDSTIPKIFNRWNKYLAAPATVLVSYRVNLGAALSAHLRFNKKMMVVLVVRNLGLYNNFKVKVELV
jgi:hypothetical protein